MSSDPWRQWQAFAAMFGPGGAGFGSGTAPYGLGAPPYVELTERFNAELRRFLEAQSAAGGEVTSEAVRRLSDSLRERFAEFFPALRGADAGAVHFTPGGTELPALGLTREHQQRWQRTLAAWNRTVEAQRRLQLLWTDALREAAAAFTARLGAAKPQLPDADGLHRLYGEWIDCAEEAYARVAHGSAFSDALAELVNAGSEWRQALKESVEHWSKWLDLPTRAELNSVIRRLQAIEQQAADASSCAAHAAPAKRGAPINRGPPTRRAAPTKRTSAKPAAPAKPATAAQRAIPAKSTTRARSASSAGRRSAAGRPRRS